MARSDEPAPQDAPTYRVSDLPAALTARGWTLRGDGLADDDGAQLYSAVHGEWTLEWCTFEDAVVSGSLSRTVPMSQRFPVTGPFHPLDTVQGVPTLHLLSAAACAADALVWAGSGPEQAAWLLAETTHLSDRFRARMTAVNLRDRMELIPGPAEPLEATVRAAALSAQIEKLLCERVPLFYAVGTFTSPDMRLDQRPWPCFITPGTVRFGEALLGIFLEVAAG